MISAKWVSAGDNAEAKRILSEALPETDYFDGDLYVLAYHNDIPASAGLLRLDCKTTDGHLYLGPIATAEPFRCRGLGELVARMQMRKAFELGYERQYIRVRHEEAGFFEKLGFNPVNIDDENIPYTEMIHEGDVGCGCGKV